MPQRVQQAAALAVRDGLICLITTRTQRRWVLPKGHIEDGHTPHKAAESEAWEEAGLKGFVEQEPVGTYEYTKNDRRHAVAVYRMMSLIEHDLWPERLLRQRQWVTIEEAIRRVKPKSLKSLLKSVKLDGEQKRNAAE